MMFNNALIKIEKIICRYLGLNGCEVETPQSIKFIKNKIFIIKNHPMQRHKSQQSLDSFIENEISESDEILKIKIGKAAGKAIAKNLIVSFEKIEIENADIQ